MRKKRTRFLDWSGAIGTSIGLTAGFLLRWELTPLISIGAVALMLTTQERS